MASTILTCTCKHEFQDKQYGKQKRVHTYGVKNDVWRCTVCLNEKKAGAKWKEKKHITQN
ncbi:MAG: hypothetical protein IPJ03_17860 [Ignavibacteriales bacterium]|nr:hypothetical protein [Ignavibacteriales bacterium]